MYECTNWIDKTKITIYKGDEVTELPDVDKYVSIVFLEAAESYEVQERRKYGAEYKQFPDYESVQRYVLERRSQLSVSKPKRKPTSKRKKVVNNPQTVEKVSSSESTADNKEQIILPPVDKSKVELVDNVFVDENGTVDESCRSFKSLNRSYQNQRLLVLNNCEYKKSAFITATVDNEPDFERMSSLATNYSKRILKRYKGRIKCIFIFLEPTKKGFWHCHFILTFVDEMPEDFKKHCADWWRKYNSKYYENQVVVKTLPEMSSSDDNGLEEPVTIDNLQQLLKYLDPLSKKKIQRAKYYPQSKKNMRHFGSVEKCIKILVPFKVVKKLAEKSGAVEDSACRKKIVIRDFQGIELLSQTSYFYYDVNYSIFYSQCQDIFENCQLQTEKSEEQIDNNEDDSGQYFQLSFFEKPLIVIRKKDAYDFPVKYQQY